MRNLRKGDQFCPMCWRWGRAMWFERGEGGQLVCHRCAPRPAWLPARSLTGARA